MPSWKLGTMQIVMFRLLALAFLCAGSVYALVYTCDPPPGTPLCQFPSKIDVAFIGTPIATNYDPDTLGPSDLAFMQVWYRFSVRESFTGLGPDEKEVVVYLSVGGGSPQIGRSFFVSAERSGDTFRLTSCGNTRPVEEAGSDIQYLRETLAHKFKPFVAGSILRHYSKSQYAVERGLDGPPRGIGGARIKIQGAAQTWNLVGDEEGQFRLNDVEPGRYTITPNVVGYETEKITTVDVPRNGCGIANIGMFTNASISGVVHRADGTPAPYVELDLIDVDPKYRAITNRLQMIKTTKNGEFYIDHVPSGQFLLGINIMESSRFPDQTPPTYFPGVEDRSSAKTITLVPNEKKTGLVLTMLPRRDFRLVRVHLRWPDGTVPTRGSIDAWANQGIYVSQYDLKDGTFELRLLQGVEYWLTAAALDQTRRPTRFVSGTWVYADNYRLISGSGPADITLTARFAEPQWANAIYGHLQSTK
jgi:hypothetical protein